MNLWVDISGMPAKRRLPYVKAAQEQGARVLLASDDVGRSGALVQRGEAIHDGTRVSARTYTLRTPADQEKVAKAEGTVVVSCPDWTIIPLENLLAARAGRGPLFARAHGAQEARTFLSVLEVGVDGIVLVPAAPRDVASVAEAIAARDRRLAKPKRSGPDNGRALLPLRAERGGKGRRREGETRAEDQDPAIELTEATVVTVQDAGDADRVCVDTTTGFADDEGMLVGSSGQSFCLVLAETAPSDWVRPRPFRVNAGALHMYLLSYENTWYLSELEAGTRCMAVTRTGTSRVAVVGRAKLERRPHVLVRWEADGRKGSAVLQRAETVRLATPEGAKAVTKLAAGDRILVHEQQRGRHMGMPIAAATEER